MWSVTTVTDQRDVCSSDTSYPQTLTATQFVCETEKPAQREKCVIPIIWAPVCGIKVDLWLLKWFCESQTRVLKTLVTRSAVENGSMWDSFASAMNLCYHAPCNQSPSILLSVHVSKTGLKLSREKRKTLGFLDVLVFARGRCGMYSCVSTWWTCLCLLLRICACVLCLVHDAFFTFRGWMFYVPLWTGSGLNSPSQLLYHVLAHYKRLQSCRQFTWIPPNPDRSDFPGCSEVLRLLRVSELQANVIRNLCYK